MFDCHVHAGPDIVDRLAGDLATASMFAEAGFDGFVLKAHYESTVGRAAAASEYSALRVFGGLALNQQCGGINPSAAAAALRSGARVIWLPTADSHTQQRARLPRLSDGDARLPRDTYALPPVAEDSAEKARAVLRLVADADAVLATGHISGPEIRWVIQQARTSHVTRLLITHPAYTVPGLSPGAIAELAQAGAAIEVTAFQLLHQPGCDAAQLAAVARAAGRRLVLSSDAGQTDSPPAPEALGRLVEALAGQGLDPGLLREAAGATPLALFTP